MSYNPSYYGTQWTSLEGIENFTNLEKINVMSNDLSEIDLSGLTKVKKELNCTKNYGLALINLGDNPIESLSPLGTDYADVEKFTMIGNKLLSLDLTVASYYVWYDGITSIDVSGCPALQTLKCDRGEKVKSLYLKKGQDIPAPDQECRDGDRICRLISLQDSILTTVQSRAAKTRRLHGLLSGIKLPAAFNPGARNCITLRMQR